jgi:transcriptional regulator with XRE-family HTH domain
VTTQHPAAALLHALQSYIDASINARLQQAGHGTPTPKALRQARGLSVLDLAAKSGISHPTISRLENGHVKRPAADTLNKLARAMAISESEYRASVAAMLSIGQPINTKRFVNTTPPNALAGSREVVEGKAGTQPHG